MYKPQIKLGGSSNPNTVGVVIGRMNMPHKGHKALILEALHNSEHVIIVLGSANQARTPKNPFTAAERQAMVESMLSQEDQSRTYFVHVKDYKYSNSDWVAEVRRQVKSIINQIEFTRPNAINASLFTYLKDDSTKYAKWFPAWTTRNVKPFFHNGVIVSATDIRKNLYSNLRFWARANSNIDRFRGHSIPWLLDENVLKKMQQIVYDKFADFERLVRWHEHDLNYEDVWGKGPHITGDPVVFCNAHVLLIKRAGPRGEGLWALPGGHLELNERVQDCILRELREETRIDVPPGKLKNCLKRIEMFDAVDRSECSRVITHAGIFVLENEDVLPSVKADTDAKEAKWVAFEKLPYMEDQMFEDHWYIVDAARKLVSTIN